MSGETVTDDQKKKKSYRGESPRINLEVGKINLHNEGLPKEIRAGGFSEDLGDILQGISIGKSIKVHRIG